MHEIEHIGTRIANLQQAIPMYQALLGTSCYMQQEVESEHVRKAFFQNGPNKIELLQSLIDDGVIVKF